MTNIFYKNFIFDQKDYEKFAIIFTQILNYYIFNFILLVFFTENFVVMSKSLINKKPFNDVNPSTVGIHEIIYNLIPRNQYVAKYM